VLWVAAVPAVLAVAVLIVFVREPERAEAPVTPRQPLRWDAARRLPSRYWLVVGLGAVFALARFSEAFLVLRAQALGLPINFIPLVLIVMNACYAGAAYPAGAAADRMSARGLLIVGLVFLIAADLLLVWARSPLLALAGAALWGLHMALTEGLLSKLVADTAPADLRGSAFGVFNLVSGVAMLAASVIAGALWTAYGPRATFLGGAAFALIAVAGLWARGRSGPAAR
jgi:predicted MFS family arabinose efflux permease